METWWLSIGAGLVTSALIAVAILTVVWLVDSTLFRPMMGIESYRATVIQYTLWNFFTTIISTLTLLPFLLLGALANTLSNVRAYAVPILCLSLFAIGGGLWANYHNQIIQAYVVFDQCYARQVIDFFMLPVLNCLRIAYNGLYPFVNFYVDMIAALRFVPPLTLFKCATQTQLLNMLAYFFNIFYVFSADLAAFLQSDFLTDEFNILNSLGAAGLWVDALISPLDCFCSALGYLYTGLAVFARLPSLHAALNCLWNVLIRLIQIPFVTILIEEPHRPNFENVTLEACCAIKSGGDAARDTVFLVAQTLWGLFTLGNQLPNPVAQLLSTQWPRIITGPLCAAAMAANVTATALVHYDSLTEPDGSGIAYLQIGLIIDELREASEGVGQIFVLFTGSAQATVTTALWGLVDVLGFVWEFTIGGIWYWLYCGPLPMYPNATYCSQDLVSFLEHWPTNYWMQDGYTPDTYTYSTYLSEFFLAAYQTTQGMGNVVTDISGSQAYGALLQYGLNVVIGLLEIFVNTIAFFWPIFTFADDPRTTARDIDFNPLFNNLYFFAGAAGDSIRQYQEPSPLTNLTCQPDALESDHTLICCAGNLVERVIDLIPVALEQVVDFIVDVIVLPTGLVTFCIPFIPGLNYTLSGVNFTAQCLRVPDLSVALFLVDEALCDFTCTIGSIIPFIGQYECIFPVPPPPTDPDTPPVKAPNCGHVGTCTGALLCSILHLFTVPLWILNSFLAMATNGIVFRQFTAFVQFVLTQFAIAIAAALAQLGLVLDCALCAFTHFPDASPNCATTIYEIFLAIGYLVRALPVLFTVLGITIFRVVVTFLVGFVTGDPIKAVVDLVVAILTDVMGGLGKAVVDFLVSLFNAIGLGFVGTFIQVLWKGFCPLLQLVLNIIIVVLNVVSFGSIKLVEFCCNGGECTPSGGLRKRMETGDDGFYDLVDGVLHVNTSNWVMGIARHMQWEPASPCNKSMRLYAERSDWASLSADEHMDVMYCVARPFWPLRTDGQTEMAPSACDQLMHGYNFTEWAAIPLGDKATLGECLEQRFYVEILRTGTGAQWFPSDWLTNWKRKYVFGGELLYGGAIYWQFASDRSRPIDVLLSPHYRTQWEQLHLNVSHYDSWHTAQDVIEFRQHTHMKDYFAWNGNAKQHDAVAALSTGVWTAGKVLMQSLYNTTRAFADRQTTDPVQYLNQGYHLGDEGAGARAGVATLVLLVLEGLMNMTEYWSNPANLKKRVDALEKVQLGTLGMYRASMQQLTMMSVEYVQDKRHQHECNAGECSLNETMQQLDSYEYAMRSDKHSLVFKASRWWQANRATLFNTYPIAYPRYPTVDQSELARRSQFTYVDAQGREQQETGRERVARYYDSLWHQSPEAEARWASMARLGTSLKEQVYVHVLRRHMAQAVQYTQLVYDHIPVKWHAATVTEEPTPPPPPQPAESHETRLFVHVAPPGHQTPTQRHRQVLRASDVDRSAHDSLQRQGQALHCGRSLSLDDAFCRDYVAGPWMPPPIQSVKRAGLRPQRLFPAKDWARGEVPGDLTIPRHSPVRRLLYTDLARTGIFHTSSFLDMTCYTNITVDVNSTLCQECFVLDQLVGRFLAAVDFTEIWFTQNFQASLTLSIQLFDYLFDENAYVVVGNGPDLSPGGFPNVAGFEYNLRYLDDNTNKTGISFGGNSSNTTAPANSTIVIIFGPLDPSYINSWVLILISDTLTAIGGTLWQFIFYNGDGATLESTLLGVVQTCIFCKWLTGEDFLGLSKRFSIGITLFIFLVGFVVISLVFAVATNFNPFGLLMSTSIWAMVLLFSFLTVYTNWGWLCWYGLPMPLADDVLYFLVYTALAKCVWFWGFLILEEDYDNTHCYGCVNTDQWTFLNCVHDRGFGDILANLVFMLELYAPEVLQWIRDSRNPVISMIYRLPWVAERVNQFYGLNLRDPTVYKQYVGCNYLVTLIPNVFIGSLFLAFAALFFPFFVLGATLILTLVSLFWQLLFIVYLMLGDIAVSMLGAPFVMSGLGDTTEDAMNPSTMDDVTEEETGFSARKPLGALNRRRRRFVVRPGAVSPPLVYEEKKNYVTLSTLTDMVRRVYTHIFARKQKTL